MDKKSIVPLEGERNKMVYYKKVRVTAKDSVLDDLLRLSKAWADENCCPSYAQNDPNEFIGHEVYLAVKDNSILGYAFGHIHVKQEKTSYNKAGEKVFDLDELYVVPTHRNQGIGKDLFRFLEKDLRDRVDVIEVIAASNKYKKLLKFYIEELDLQFNHALLVKRTRQSISIKDMEE